MPDNSLLFRRTPVNQGDIELGLTRLANAGHIESWSKAVDGGRVWYHVRMKGMTGYLRDGLTLAEAGAVVEALRHVCDV